MGYKETQRARYWELQKQIEAIEKVANPLRAKRDKHVQAARKIEDAMNAEIKKAEEGLFDLRDEFAGVARSVGNVGERPE